MINARSETASIKPAFSDALKFRRCLIPADGFYEWQKSGKEKQPYCFEVNRGELFSFAGLWETWDDPSGLNTRITDPSEASELLKPFGARLMNCFPVSSRVNRAANDDPECSARVEINHTQGDLF
jgi:putative SOS response-associated peptidase YedK